VLNKVLFTVVYKDGKTGYPCIKRCRIEGYILNRDYLIVPDDAEVLFVGTKDKFQFTVRYVKARIKSETFDAAEFAEKGLKTLGVRLAPREAVSVEVVEPSGGLRKAAAKIADKAKDDDDANGDLFAEKKTEKVKTPAKAAAAKKPSTAKKPAESRATGTVKSPAKKAVPAPKKPAAKTVDAKKGKAKK
jgi:topoisomerase-4 subunit A